MQNSFYLDARKEWNTDFLSDKTIKKLNVPFGKDYYARMEGNRICEIYSVDEEERLIREPLTTLLLFPMAVSVQNDGFELYGIHYTKEQLWRDEREITRLENN